MLWSMGGCGVKGRLGSRFTDKLAEPFEIVSVENRKERCEKIVQIVYIGIWS